MTVIASKHSGNIQLYVFRTDTFDLRLMEMLPLSPGSLELLGCSHMVFFLTFKNHNFEADSQACMEK